jgi:hypothetical protein
MNDNDRVGQMLDECVRLEQQATTIWRQLHWRSYLYHTFQIPSARDKLALLQTQLSAVRTEVAALRRGIRRIEMHEHNALQSGMDWKDTLVRNIRQALQAQGLDKLWRDAVTRTQYDERPKGSDQ